MSSLKPAILVVDDEIQIRKFLKVSFEAHEYKFMEATNGKEALLLTGSNNPDLIILDLGLPDMDGQEVLVKLREWYRKPIIILSVRDDDNNIVRALEREASDYVRKPFSLNELLARVKNLLKNDGIKQTAPQLEFSHLKIDLESRRVFFDENEIRLTATEYDLLKFFAINSGKILTHTQILKNVWGPNSGDHTQYLRVYVAHLRQKIEKKPSNPQLLINEPGVGYRFGS